MQRTTNESHSWIASHIVDSRLL